MNGRISTGISGLDNMLHGGLVPKRPYIVSGPPGSGKTTLCMQFLLDGMKNDESVLMVALDEPPNEVKENMQAFGWDISGIRILDATPDVKGYSKTKSVKEISAVMDVKVMKEITDIRKSQALRSLEISIQSVQQMLKQETREYKELTGQNYSRMVIDSLTALRFFGMKGFDERISIQSFLRFLSELEVTTLIASELPDPSTLEAEFIIVRGELRLHKWWEKHHIKRGISIERFRGSLHDLYMRPLEITDNGLTVHTDMVCEGYEKEKVAYMRSAEKEKKVTEEEKKVEGAQTMDIFQREKKLKEKFYKSTRTL